MTNILDPEKLVQAIEGPRISVPFALIHNLHGDFQAAAFLAQAAYFSALSRKKDGWFDLKSIGTHENPENSLNIFAAAGSWEALLGAGKDAQRAIRKKLVSLKLLEESLRGIPARLHYRVDSHSYLTFLASSQKTQENQQLAEIRQLDAGNPKTGKRKSANLMPANPLTIPNSFPKSLKKSQKRNISPEEKISSGQVASHLQKEIDQNFELQLQTTVDPFIVLPLLGGDEYEIYQPLVDELVSLYPAVDVRQEFRNMRGWLLANPKERKTKAGIARFYTAWLAKKQDRSGYPGGKKREIGDKLTRGKWGNFEEKNYREGTNGDGTF